MWLDALLAYAHLAAILSWVVFLSSTAALARSEWLNPAALARLLVVDGIAHAAGWAVVATGVARLVWGAKGAAWWLSQPLLWAKIGLVALMLLAAWRTRRQLANWNERECGECRICWLFSVDKRAGLQASETDHCSNRIRLRNRQRVRHTQDFIFELTCTIGAVSRRSITKARPAWVHEDLH